MAFVQTQFFGLSIVNFTASMGWGDSPSTCNITLVNDPSNGDYLTVPIQGQPAEFTYGSFVFGGIVKSFSRSDDFSASPLYTLILEDPRELLSGVSLILSGYNGVITVPNIMNIYGYLENTGGFGFSRASSSGIPWEKVRDSLVSLTSGLSPSYGGAIRLGNYEFRINLNNLPSLPSFYRITSPNISVLDFIREVCDAANHDYFFTLEIINNINYIVLKTINRNVAPINGLIEAFVLTTPGASSKNVGYEFRNEITSKFLIGGPVSRMYGIEYTDNDDIDPATNPEDNTIWPFWGTKNETDVVDNISVGSDVIIGVGTSDEHMFTVDSRLLKSELIRNNKIGMFDTYTIDIGELRAAKYSQEAWEGYLWFHNYNQFKLFDPDINNKRAGIAYARRIDKFNDVGDYIGYEVGQLTYDDRGEVTYKFNFQYYRDDVFTTEVPGVEPKIYGIPNPHWGKADRLGLVGGLVLSEVALFLGSRTNQEINNLTAQSFSTMKRLDHANGADSKQQEENIARIYSFVKKYAEENYGKKWMVKVPAISAYKDSETNEIRFSHEPEDTGFIDESQWDDAIRENLLPFDVNRLTDTDGKFYAYVKYPKYVDVDVTDIINASPNSIDNQKSAGRFDYTRAGRYYKRYYYLFNDIPEDDKIDSEVYNSIFIKCEVDKTIYFEDAATQYSPRIVITMPGIVKIKYKDTNDVGIVANFLRYEKHARNNSLELTEEDEANIQSIIGSFGSDIFLLGYEGYAYIPHFAAVPLKSNVLVYGPWYASGANGRTEFEQDDTLVPWNYGGFSAMNNAANAKVTSAISLYNISEAGSVEYPDIPGLSLGDPLTNGGSYVTEVTVSIDGSSGARTNYNLSTWTPHPYRMRKFLSDYISRLSKNNQQLRRNFRQQLRQPKQKSRLAEFKTRAIDSLRRRPRSTHYLIGGQVVQDEDGFTKSIVGLQPSYNSITQLYGSGYETKALASLDTLFVPFSTNSDVSNMARFERPTDSGSLNIDDYNPFRQGLYGPIFTHGQTFPSGLSTEQDSSIDYNDVRAIALKSPLILAGWGYDTDGKPVPNSGVIATSGDPTDDFHQDYLRRQDYWKVGPLDTRWNEERKVWTAGGGTAAKFVQILDRQPSSGLTNTVVRESGTFITYFDNQSLFPIGNIFLNGRYSSSTVNGNRVLLGGYVYYVREYDISFSGSIGSRCYLTPTNNYHYAANIRPNVIEPSGIWTAYEINGKLLLDNQMQFWDYSLVE